MKRRPLVFMINQRGATLIVALVMLVLMTLLAVSAINLSSGNLKMVGNMQYQQEASSAAQAAVNQVLSRAIYLKKPASAPTQIVVNVNGHDYTVQLSRPCLKSVEVITVEELSSLPPAEAARCSTSNSVKNSGILGQSSGGLPSDCSRVLWEIRANVNEPSTNAQAVIVEGASMKMDRVIADVYKRDADMRCS